MCELPTRIFTRKDEWTHPSQVQRMCMPPHVPLHPYFWLSIRYQVSHVVGRPNHPTDSFLLLSKEATKSVVFHDNFSCPTGELSWCCKHCLSHFESYICLAKIGDPPHPGTASPSVGSVALITCFRHSISEPVQRVDKVYQRQKVLPYRYPYFLGIDVLGMYRCKNCPSRRSPRLWQMLLLHLKDK